MLLTSARLARPRYCYNIKCRTFGSSGPSFSVQPNLPIDLDTSLQTLLKDVHLSLKHPPHPRPEPRKLEAIPVEASAGGLSLELEVTEEILDTHRKSPAALFGSQRIGAVVLPQQLQSTITSVINDSNKALLHSDAKRLFNVVGDDGDEGGWQIQYDTKYRSRKQGARHAERDGTAFASIALPAHYSAIASVFDNLKRRMEPGWEVERVIDWGAATGSGLWASLFAFQKPSQKHDEADMLELEASTSSLGSYLGIDKREGLVALGKRLFLGIPKQENLTVQWQRVFKEVDKIPRREGQKTLALSAFILSSLPSALARKILVKEMWESGAQTLVLIDLNTQDGFEAIAQAREYILNMGRKELDDPEAESWPVRGAHVVAPCPHDGACPLFNPGSSRHVCGFTQRIQRPEFLRLTKQSTVGHEDIEYSYVVIQRGARPGFPSTRAGRTGIVGQRALINKQAKEFTKKELMLYEEGAEEPISEPTLLASTTSEIETEEIGPPDLQKVLRKEAYHWPRLVFPPMKKSGHIILDSCTPEGKIMRLTIPKSQGKQPFYDARKSSWGDLFPHAPKNKPQERVVVSSRNGNVKAVKGDHIGKRRGSNDAPEKLSYENLAVAIREAKKNTRQRWERHERVDKVWGEE